MRPKKASIHLRTIKHKRSSIETMQLPDELFSFHQLSQLPPQLRSKLDSLNCTDTNIIKTKIHPHGYLVVFYLAFLKLRFIQKSAFQKCVTQLFQILDDDNFVIQTVKDQSSYLFLDWSISKMKRIASEYFKKIIYNEYQNVAQILQENNEFGKILFFVFWSLLYDSKKVEHFQELIEFQTVKEVLFDYFQLQAEFTEDAIFLPDSSILIETVNDSDLYLINLPNFQSELEKGTCQSIPIKYDMGASDMASQLKLTLQSNQCLDQDSENNLVKTKNFADMTNRTQNTNQNMQKTLRFRQLQFHSPQQRPYMTSRQALQTRLNNFMDESDESDKSCDKYLYSTQGDDCKENVLTIEVKESKEAKQNKFKFDRLFQIKTTTQKSLYDINPIDDSDEYSVLDISIPTSKKIHEKIVTKDIKNQDMVESLKPQHESLIGKWYQFCKSKKSKTDIQTKISKIGKKVEKKSHFQETTERPDFRKVKSRRRKSQDFDQENYPSQESKNCPLQGSKNSPLLGTKNTEARAKIPIGQELKLFQLKEAKQDSDPLAHLQKKAKQYIVHNPKVTGKGQNIYSKFGYVNMNISEEFTDSLILKELESKNQENIKAIKQKAREERKTIKLLVEKAAQKADIIKL